MRGSKYLPKMRRCCTLKCSKSLHFFKLDAISSNCMGLLLLYGSKHTKKKQSFRCPDSNWHFAFYCQYHIIIFRFFKFISVRKTTDIPQQYPFLLFKFKDQHDWVQVDDNKGLREKIHFCYLLYFLICWFDFTNLEAMDDVDRCYCFG